MSDQQPMMAEQIVYRLTNFRLLLKCYFHPCCSSRAGKPTTVPDGEALCVLTNVRMPRNVGFPEAVAPIIVGLF